MVYGLRKAVHLAVANEAVAVGAEAIDAFVDVRGGGL
jgi:hypothetical protein